MKKTDYAIAFLIVFFTGIAAVPTAVALGARDPVILLALPWIGGIAILFGVWLGALLARRLPFFWQLGKFGAVGILNTAIDFGVLNLLSLASGITAGLVVGGVNLPGFAAAVVNSYLWNKLWVFQNGKAGERLFADFPKFFGVKLVGVAINSSLIILLTTYGPIFGGIAPSARLNIAKAVATIVTLIWNFVGYKFFVFVEGKRD